MAFSIKDLLNDAVGRAHISRQVLVARLIAQANEQLAAMLPPGRGQDAQAVAYKDGQLIIACKNSAAAHFVSQRQGELRAILLRAVPQIGSLEIKTRPA
jgi:hypothetical protein